jgi:hypothetical protein
MKADFRVVLDACVLANFGVCDLLLRLAERPRLYPKGEVEGLWLRVEGLKLSGLRTLAWSPRG